MSPFLESPVQSLFFSNRLFIPRTTEFFLLPRSSEFVVVCNFGHFVCRTELNVRKTIPLKLCVCVCED